MEDTFRDLHGDLREDFKDVVDLLGDPFDEDMEVKGPL